MSEKPPATRTLILAPNGRDAVVAKGLLRDAKLSADICIDVGELLQELKRGADTAIVTEEAAAVPNATALLNHARAFRP